MMASEVRENSRLVEEAELTLKQVDDKRSQLKEKAISADYAYAAALFLENALSNLVQDVVAKFAKEDYKHFTFSEIRDFLQVEFQDFISKPLMSDTREMAYAKYERALTDVFAEIIDETAVADNVDRVKYNNLLQYILDGERYRCHEMQYGALYEMTAICRSNADYSKQYEKSDLDGQYAWRVLPESMRYLAQGEQFHVKGEHATQYVKRESVRQLVSNDPVMGVCAAVSMGLKEKSWLRFRIHGDVPSVIAAGREALALGVPYVELDIDQQQLTELTQSNVGAKKNLGRLYKNHLKLLAAIYKKREKLAFNLHNPNDGTLAYSFNTRTYLKLNHTEKEYFISLLSEGQLQRIYNELQKYDRDNRFFLKNHPASFAKRCKALDKSILQAQPNALAPRAAENSAEVPEEEMCPMVEAEERAHDSRFVDSGSYGSRESEDSGLMDEESAEEASKSISESKEKAKSCSDLLYCALGQVGSKLTVDDESLAELCFKFAEVLGVVPDYDLEYDEKASSEKNSIEDQKKPPKEKEEMSSLDTDQDIEKSSSTP